MYQYYNPNPYGKRTGDCVIRAICKATGLEWLDVYLGLCIEGAHNGDWGNTNSVWGAYLRQRGFVRQVIPNTCPDCYTVEDFCRDHPTGTFILATGTHAVCLQDGVIYDSWDSTKEIPVYFFEEADQ